MIMKEKAGSVDKAKKTVQFNPTVPEVNIPTLPVSFHSKKKNDEIVLKRLKELTDNDPNHSSTGGVDYERVSGIFIIVCYLEKISFDLWFFVLFLGFLKVEGLS